MKWILPIFTVLSITFATFLVVWFRHAQLAAGPPGEAPAAPPKHLMAFAFTMAAALFGFAVTATFYAATGWWQNADRILFFTATGFMLFLSVAAIIVRTQVIQGGAAESVVLNVFWGLGYGWLLPTVMKAAGLIRTPV